VNADFSKLMQEAFTKLEKDGLT